MGSETDDGVSCHQEIWLMKGFHVNGNMVDDEVCCEWEMRLMLGFHITIVVHYMGKHLSEINQNKPFACHDLLI